MNLIQFNNPTIKLAVAASLLVVPDAKTIRIESTCIYLIFIVLLKHVFAYLYILRLARKY